MINQLLYGVEYLFILSTPSYPDSYVVVADSWLKPKEAQSVTKKTTRENNGPKANGPDPEGSTSRQNCAPQNSSSFRLSPPHPPRSPIPPTTQPIAREPPPSNANESNSLSTYSLYSKNLGAGPTRCFLADLGEGITQKLENLDVFKIDRDRCYEAVTSDNTKAVIGFLNKGPLATASTPRKRQKVEDDDCIIVE